MDVGEMKVTERQQNAGPCWAWGAKRPCSLPPSSSSPAFGAFGRRIGPGKPFWIGRPRCAWAAPWRCGRPPSCRIERRGEALRALRRGRYTLLRVIGPEDRLLDTLDEGALLQGLLRRGRQATLGELLFAQGEGDSPTP